MLSEAMAIHHDQDDLGEQPDPEIVGFMHRVCVTWASWAYAEQDKLGVKAITRIWVIKPPLRKRALDLTDEQLEIVDKKIAQLTSRERNMLHDEYLHRLPMWQKTRRYNLELKAYQKRINQLLVDLYYALMPDSEEWRMAIL